MRKMTILTADSEGRSFILATTGQNPAVCKITDLFFDDDTASLQMQVDWIAKGSYTNGKRKKILARTMLRILTHALRYTIH